MWMIPKVIGGQKKLSIVWKHVFPPSKDYSHLLILFLHHVIITFL